MNTVKEDISVTDGDAKTPKELRSLSARISKIDNGYLVYLDKEYTIWEPGFNGQRFFPTLGTAVEFVTESFETSGL